MGLFISKIYPYVIALIISILSFLYSFYIPYQKLPLILPQSMTLGGIIIGFFATTLTILYSIDDTKPIIKKLKSISYYEIIVSYLFQTIYFGFFLASVSTLGLFLNFEVLNLFGEIYFSVWSFSFSASIFLSLRIILILGKVLNSP